MRRLFRALHGMSTACGTLPLLAAVVFVTSARLAAFVGPPSEPVAMVQLEPSGDQIIIESVLKKRAPDLGLTLRRQLSNAIVDESKKANFDPLLIVAIIDVESDFEDEAVSNKGARGLMQIKPSTLHYLAEKEGIRLTRDEVASDTILQVRLGIRYLRQLHTKFGDLDYALMAYNAGPARIRQAMKDRDVEPFRRYPQLVRRDFRRFREGVGLEGDWALALRAPPPPDPDEPPAD